MEVRVTNDVWVACKHCGWQAIWYSGEKRPDACGKCKDATEEQRAVRKKLVQEESVKFYERVKANPLAIAAAVRDRIKALS